MTNASSLSDKTALRDEVVPRRVRQFGSARDGLGEWRSLHRWVFDAFGSRGLSAHHGSGRPCLWHAGWHFVLRPRVERINFDQICLRV